MHWKDELKEERREGFEEGFKVGFEEGMREATIYNIYKMVIEYLHDSDKAIEEIMTVYPSYSEAEIREIIASCKMKEN